MDMVILKNNGRLYKFYLLFIVLLGLQQCDNLMYLKLESIDEIPNLSVESKSLEIYGMDHEGLKLFNKDIKMLVHAALEGGPFLNYKNGKRLTIMLVLETNKPVRIQFSRSALIDSMGKAITFNNLASQYNSEHIYRPNESHEIFLRFDIVNLELGHYVDLPCILYLPTVEIKTTGYQISLPEIRVLQPENKSRLKSL